MCVFLSPVSEHVKIDAKAKVPLAKDAALHVPGGGNVEICRTTHATQTDTLALHQALATHVSGPIRLAHVCKCGTHAYVLMLLFIPLVSSGCSCQIRVTLPHTSSLLSLSLSLLMLSLPCPSAPSIVYWSRVTARVAFVCLAHVCSWIHGVLCVCSVV